MHAFHAPVVPVVGSRPGGSSVAGARQWVRNGSSSIREPSVALRGQCGRGAAAPLRQGRPIVLADGVRLDDHAVVPGFDVIGKTDSSLGGCPALTAVRSTVRANRMDQSSACRPAAYHCPSSGSTGRPPGADIGTRSQACGTVGILDRQAITVTMNRPASSSGVRGGAGQGGGGAVEWLMYTFESGWWTPGLDRV